MNKTFFFLLLTLQFFVKHLAFSQSTTDKNQQFESIGNFQLENGKQILDCKIGYRTFGKLNVNRNNAIIYPTAGGMTTYMMQLFGVGSEVDTNKYYLIMIDALGNGVSSSPNNSLSQAKTSFPQFTVRDMVNSQYKLLTEKMNIHHLTTVMGASMGAIQALQWAVSYPDFMDKVISIEGTPKLSSYDLLWMHIYVDAVESDTAYHHGNYSVNPNLTFATQLVQLILTTPAKLNSLVPAENLFTWLSSLEKNPFKVDANNILWQTKAVMNHDITTKAGGSLENTAKLIKAKMLIIANKQDHNINQALSIKFAEMANAELVTMDNEFGHLIFGEKIVNDATRKFLSQ